MLDILKHLTAACRRLRADDICPLAAAAFGAAVLGLWVVAMVRVLTFGTGVLP